MSITRRSVLRGVVVAAATFSMGTSLALAVPPRALLVYDSRLPQSRALKFRHAGRSIDLAYEHDNLWRNLRNLRPTGTIVGLTTWSDLVQVRALLESGAAACARKRAAAGCSIGRWPDRGADLVYSTLDHPRLEFAFECRLRFTRVLAIPDVHSGGFRSAVLLDEGTFEGPRLRGRAVPNSGGDYAHFRADDTAVFDARYLLEVDDGTLIYMQNRGFLWGRTPDAMARLRAWAYEGGPPVPHEDYYLRAQPTFETPKGQHDWLTRHVFVGIGERKPDGNFVRYYVVT